MWQPIDTAPRGEDIPIMVWDGKQCAIVTRLGDSGWIIADSYGFNEDGEVFDVTHWMPLPEGPKV